MKFLNRHSLEISYTLDGHSFFSRAIHFVLQTILYISFGANFEYFSSRNRNGVEISLPKKCMFVITNKMLNVKCC